MRYTVIPDLHGKDRTWWGDAVKNALSEENHKVVFLGDYLDDWTVPNVEMKENLIDIIQLKQDNQTRVILLIGNHELNYWLPGHVNNPYSCSGYRPDMHWDFHHILSGNKDLFQLAYQDKNYLWTHAGITTGWWEYDYPFANKNLDIVAESLNNSLDKMEPSIFQVGYTRGGFKDVGGPLWADKSETYKKPLKGLHQIVGHSKVDTVKTFTKDSDTSITYCDCLDKNNEFYTIEI